MREQRRLRWAVPAMPATLLALMLAAVGADRLSRYHAGVEWYLGAAHGRTLVVAMRGGVCDHIDHVEVDQSPAAVTVAVIYEFPGRDVVCPDQGTVRCAAITLDAPLGDRRLVHTAAAGAAARTDAYPLIHLPDDMQSLFDANCPT